ncbi:MAG: hypothetical protein U0Z53_27690 [Blastocatellia bacterium]
MSFHLSFLELIEYDSGVAGVALPVTLQSGSGKVSFDAKLDTGATHCIFERVHGENIGCDIESGELLVVSTATGIFRAYGHQVTLSVRDFDFDVMVYFAEDYVFSRNVLGRHGFLNLVRLGLIDYNGKLYLSRYGANGEA